MLSTNMNRISRGDERLNFCLFDEEATGARRCGARTKRRIERRGAGCGRCGKGRRDLPGAPDWSPFAAFVPAAVSSAATPPPGARTTFACYYSAHLFICNIKRANKARRRRALTGRIRDVMRGAGVGASTSPPASANISSASLDRARKTKARPSRRCGQRSVFISTINRIQ